MAKVVLAEDDPMISEIYQKKFSESGFEIFPAMTGDQVLTVTEKNKPDLVLLDLIMPNMDGFEILKHLRGEGFDPELKIIISSNLSQREDRNRALELGANGFVAKAEYTPTQLVEEVRRLFNQFKENKKNLARAVEAQAEATADAPAKAKKRILLIEDETIFIEMFGEKLRQDGFDVVTAENGAWGMKEALKGDFDLIILDMIMPAMTGEEIIGKLKLEEKTKNVPIVAMSASVDDMTEEKVKSLGVAAFFYKTQLIPSQLSEKIQEILKS